MQMSIYHQYSLLIIMLLFYFNESSVAIIISHYKNKIYSYVNDSKHPCISESENDKQWIEGL